MFRTQALLNADDSQIGLITSFGWLGILTTIPVVILTKDHTTWLFVAGFLNCAAPIARAFAASAGSATAVIATNFVAGMGFGILSAWPAMLAAMWTEEHRTVVTAAACLSNYVGGAAGVMIIPMVAYDAETLRSFLIVQAWVAAVPFGLMYFWTWLPDMNALLTPPDTDPDTEVSVAQEIQHALQKPLAVTILAFGLLAGLSLLLQGMTGYILTGMGFNTLESSIGSFCYQLSSAVVGTVIGFYMQDHTDLEKASHAFPSRALVNHAACAARRSSSSFTPPWWPRWRCFCSWSLSTWGLPRYAAHPCACRRGWLQTAGCAHHLLPLPSFLRAGLVL
jgi:MFS family permease